MPELWANDYSGRLLETLDAATPAGETFQVTPDLPAAAVGNRVRARIGTEILTLDVTAANECQIVARESEDSDRYPKRTWPLGTAVDLVLTSGQLLLIIGDQLAPSNIPEGGSAGNLLVKLSGDDFDVGWSNIYNQLNVWGGIQAFQNGLLIGDGGLDLATLSYASIADRLVSDTTFQAPTVIASDLFFTSLSGSVALLEAAAATDIPLTVKGQSGQTANLVELQNALGTVLARVDANGVATFAGLTGQVTVTPATSATRGLVVKGVASQSANLTEWQNSTGTQLVVIGPTGNFSMPGGGTFSTTGFTTTTGGISSQTWGLSIQAAAFNDGDARTNLGIDDTSALAAGIGAGISLGGRTTAAASYTRFVSIKAVKENATSGNTAAAMVLATRPNGGSITERMRLGSDGTLTVASGFGVGSTGQILTNQTAAGTTLGTVTNKLPIYNAAGTLVGYIPIYDAIT